MTSGDKADLGPQSHSWLNDRHMTAAQILLKCAHSDVAGLQAPTLQCTRTFEVHQEKQFVQILNLSKSHWITISTLNCQPGTVHVYDSMQLGLNSSLKRIVADLMFYKGKKITIKYMHIQQQKGASDCGLFAIATATALCNGIEPNKLQFNQKLMRQHLKRAIEQQNLGVFPAIHVARKPAVIMVEYMRIYCTCRHKRNNRAMIECTSCEE